MTLRAERPAGDGRRRAGAKARSRAAVLGAPGEVRLVERAPPEPAPGEVRIALEGCGVCGSSLPVWEGRPWFAYPMEPGLPGHEGWGVVDALGDGVDPSLLGQRVAALSYAAHAEHDLAAADAVVPIPAELAGGPFPGEPLGCAMNVFDRSDVQPGHTVAIVGVGFLGMVLVQLCAAAGARVLALGRRPFALDLARSLGADEVVEVHEPDEAARRVADATDGRGCERVIEAAGVQATLSLATRLAGVRSRLVVAGFHQDGPREVDMQAWGWNGIDVINAHEREGWRAVAGMRAAVDAVRRGRIDLAPMLTHTFPIDRLSDAYAAMRERPDGFLKALVTT